MTLLRIVDTEVRTLVINASEVLTMAGKRRIQSEELKPNVESRIMVESLFRENFANTGEELPLRFKDVTADELSFYWRCI